MSRISCLHDRAHMLAKARAFFAARNVLEVDCPAISRLASVDAHIDLVPVSIEGTTAHLHSSPEYGMKRLLSEGIGDIYQLSHVYRDGEIGSRHNPEFMMAEWYRVGMSFDALVQETLDFCALILGALPYEMLSYEEAFVRYAHINPFTATDAELQALIPDSKADSRDDLLNYIIALLVEPHLGKNSLTALTYFPPTQAALAKRCTVNGHLVAERFEVYHEGVELANGYHELQDPKEQLKRLQEANELRLQLGKKALPIDMNFIQALEKGLPECSGVAVGFDRLMMLRHKSRLLRDVIAFDWHSA